MITPSPKTSRLPGWLFRTRESLILKGRLYCVKERVGRGGFGELYAICPNDSPREVFVVKFLRDIGEFHHNEPEEKVQEIVVRLKLLFQREWKMLKQMSGAHPKCFPAFYGAGECEGRPFYIMESLTPVGIEHLKRLTTDVRRMRFIGDLCNAVDALHKSGLVHYDIKPQNVLFRENAGEYVLGDFGSIHREESHQAHLASRYLQAQCSLSMLMDGRRISPRTVGYCDPIDSLHTKHADIYAIGQVIRDMFADEVPALWARIILKCINRNFGMRYDSVEDVRRDVMGMGGNGASRLTQEISSVLSPEGAAWLRDRAKVYVSAVARPGGSGSERAPFRSICDALRVAPPDSVILVGRGVYDEHICLKDRRIDLVAVEGPQKTMIRGGRGFAVVQITNGADGSLVKGFTITGGTGLRTEEPTSYGYDYYGGGINANVSATIEDCAIIGNGHGVPRKTSSTFGGGVCVSGATVALRNCRISDNFAWASGGGLMADGRGAALVLVDCTVEHNDSTDFFGRQGGIGLANSATLSVSGCIVANNAGDQIGAFGNAHANGTRAQVERSYVQGGAKACNIPLFIARPNNFKMRPKKIGACGCGKDIMMQRQGAFRHNCA